MDRPFLEISQRINSLASMSTMSNICMFISSYKEPNGVHLYSGVPIPRWGHWSPNAFYTRRTKRLARQRSRGPENLVWVLILHWFHFLSKILPEKVKTCISNHFRCRLNTSKTCKVCNIDSKKSSKRWQITMQEKGFLSLQNIVTKLSSYSSSELFM